MREFKQRTPSRWLTGGSFIGNFGNAVAIDGSSAAKAL